MYCEDYTTSTGTYQRIDWEQRKLGELYKTYSGMTPPRSELSNFENPTIPWIKTTDLGNTKIENNEEDISDKAASKLRILPNKTVLIAMYGGFNQIGRTGMLTYQATINQALVALEPINEINQFFLMTELNYRVNDWKRLAASSRKDPNITKKDVDNFTIYYPLVEEQNKISSLFELLDLTIILHQRKLESLERLKRVFLQNIFPSDSESTPKLRFDNFGEDWEQRKLGEVAEIIGGGTPSTSNKDYWDGDIDWYSPVEIGEQTYVYGSQKKITEFGLQKSSAKILPIGTVLFTSRAGIGNTAILAKEGTTNQGFQSIIPCTDELDSYFIYSRTHELKRYGDTNGAGSTFVEVSGKEMAKMPILIPTLEEQSRIGNFFKLLDNIIALYHEKIAKLQKLKTAYLQNLFI